MAEKVLVTARIGELDMERALARQEVARWIRGATSLTVAALLGVAVGLSLSVVFVAGGVFFALLTIPVALTGLLAHYLIPPILADRRVRGR